MAQPRVDFVTALATVLLIGGTMTGLYTAKAWRDSERRKARARTVVYDLTTGELEGQETTVYPRPGETVRVAAASAGGTRWVPDVGEGAPIVAVDSRQSDMGDGRILQEFFIKALRPGNAVVTLTALDPGDNPISAVDVGLQIAWAGP